MFRVPPVVALEQRREQDEAEDQDVEGDDDAHQSRDREKAEAALQFIQQGHCLLFVFTLHRGPNFRLIDAR